MKMPSAPGNGRKTKAANEVFKILPSSNLRGYASWVEEVKTLPARRPGCLHCGTMQTRNDSKAQVR